MLWLILVVCVAIAESLSSFIDNYITDVCFKGRKSQAQELFGVPACLIICIITAIIFPLQVVPLQVAGILILTGILNSLSFLFYYKALSDENATGAVIFLQLSPVLYFILGWFLLGEHISSTEIVAGVFILLAPLVVILSANKRSKKMEMRAATFLIMFSIIQVVANIIFVKFSGLDEIALNNEIGLFATAFFLAMFGRFISDFALVCIFKSWRAKFWRVAKQFKHKLFIPMAINEIMYAAVEFALRFALIIAPVAIVSVTANALELTITFILGIILSILWPVFGREKLKKRNILSHLAAILLAMIGIILLQ